MSARNTAPLRAVPPEPAGYRYDNPVPCGCCRHGHVFAAKELVVRRLRDGVVVKVMYAAPGGYEDRK